MRGASLLPHVVSSFALAAAPAAADVLIVDPLGSQGFATVQAAVDASQQGDLILVRSGTYPGFTVAWRELTLRADVHAEVVISSGVTVLGTPAGRTTLLSGLEINGKKSTGGFQPGQTALTIADNFGFVRVQECALVGGGGIYVSCNVSTAGGDGCSVTNSPKAAFVDCILRGGLGGGDWLQSCFGGPGGRGLRTQGSAVVLYDCGVRGGDGGIADLFYTYTGGAGGPGCEVLDQGLFASNCSFVGGTGGYAYNGGAGGDGLIVHASAQVHVLECDTLPGYGGTGEGGPDGPDGQATVVDGTLFVVPGTSRVLASAALAGDGSVLDLDVEGEPGDAIWVVPGQAAAHVPAYDLSGAWLVSRPSLVTKAPLAVLGPTGKATVSILAPPLDATQGARTLFLQVFALATDGQVTLGSPAHVTVVDCASVGPDCNASGTFDTCDVLSGASIDCNENSVPDECELDCNGNGIADACDIASGTSDDKNGNGVPDECEPHGQVWYVDVSAPPGGDGSVASPFQSIEAAIAPSLDGDTILVADGVYTGPLNRNLTFGGRDLVVRSQNGSAACVIDCQDLGTAFEIEDQESAASRIEGFTIVDGKTFSWGGGIRLIGAHTQIRDVVFQSCRASEGGGLDLSNSFAVVTGCRFEQGSAEHGAGLSIHGGSPRVSDCTFESNFADGGYGGEGGGVYVSSGFAILLTHLRLVGNGSSKWAGAIMVDVGSVNIANCLIAGNSAPQGGAIRTRWGNLYVRSTTFAGNLAVGQGAIYSENPDGAPRNLRLDNSIAWDDPAANGALILNVSPGVSIQVERCDLRGGPASIAVASGSSLAWGAGNFDLDPLFADPLGPDGDPLTFADNDYRLGALSPCTDAGDNALVIPDVYDLDGDGDTLEPTPIDLDGLPRFADDPAVPDTGAGTPPIVDMGAFERQ